MKKNIPMGMRNDWRALNILHDKLGMTLILAGIDTWGILILFLPLSANESNPSQFLLFLH